jgi:hypothetical protein
MSKRNDDRRHERSLRYSREQQPIPPRATNQEVQKWVSRQHGFVPESALLLHCKEQFGLAAPGTAPEETPCPPEKVAAIKQAFRRFGRLDDNRDQSSR